MRSDKHRAHVLAHVKAEKQMRKRISNKQRQVILKEEIQDGARDLELAMKALTQRVAKLRKKVYAKIVESNKDQFK